MTIKEKDGKIEWQITNATLAALGDRCGNKVAVHESGGKMVGSFLVEGSQKTLKLKELAKKLKIKPGTEVEVKIEAVTFESNMKDSASIRVTTPTLPTKKKKSSAVNAEKNDGTPTSTSTIPQAKGQQMTPTQNQQEAQQPSSSSSSKSGMNVAGKIVSVIAILLICIIFGFFISKINWGTTWQQASDPDNTDNQTKKKTGNRSIGLSPSGLTNGPAGFIINGPVGAIVYPGGSANVIVVPDPLPKGFEPGNTNSVDKLFRIRQTQKI